MPRHKARGVPALFSNVVLHLQDPEAGLPVRVQQGDGKASKAADNAALESLREAEYRTVVLLFQRWVLLALLARALPPAATNPLGNPPLPSRARLLPTAQIALSVLIGVAVAIAYFQDRLVVDSSASRHAATPVTAALRPAR